VKNTGNDIVALNAIDIQRTNTPAFYLKIITASEQSLYHAPEIEVIPFHNFVWLLWSVKESVYKYLKRADPKLIFPPTKIVVQSIRPPVNLSAPEFNDVWENDGSTEDIFCGEVIFESHRLYFRSKATTAFIATIVNHLPDFEGVYWGVKSIDNSDTTHQSKQVREFAVQKLNSILNAETIIEKNGDGCPIVVNEGRHTTTPISLYQSPQGLSVEDPAAGISRNHSQGPFQETLRGRDLGSLKDIAIRKNQDGCPIIISNGKQLDTPISLAHHDKFVSYSFVI
jgi:phosphopantetheinyl transferase (holo-ACP synthase)